MIDKFNSSSDANLSFLSDLNVDLNVQDKLSRLITRIEDGNNDVYTTPFAKDYGIDKMFSDWNKVFYTNRSKLNPTLINLEMEQRSKFGPRSIASPWKERRSTLEDSFTPAKGINASKVEMIQNGLGRRLRPLSLDAAMKLLKNDTNSGLPYFTKKGLVKNRVLDNFDTLIARKDPCVLFTRTQEAGKTRNVWGYPMADTLKEMCYYSPLLGIQKELKYRSALNSPEMVSQRMTEIVTEAVKRKRSIISIDFSSYDNSVKRQLQKVAFDYIKSCFQAYYHSDIDRLFERFNSIGILNPEGIWSGEHGVPSGSTFTNEVDSIVQVSIAQGLSFIDREHFQVQGDDGVYLIPNGSEKSVYNGFESCGLLVNRDKSFVSSKFAVYLQNLYHIDYINNGIIGGIYPVYRALNRLTYQERWSDFEEYDITGRDYYSIRAICILENCKFHPLYEDLVKFVLKYDKYSLSVTEQGIKNYVQMIQSTKGAGEILNHQYGDNVSGIKSFETFKLIKRLG